MLSDTRLLIGVDSCVLIEAVRLKDRDSTFPSVRLLQLLTNKIFTLLLIELVEEEVRRVLRKSGEEAQLDELLSRCDMVVCQAATEEQIMSEWRTMVGHLRHVNDVGIAVALRHCLFKPDLFLSSNTEHWRPSLSDVLGGIEVTTVKAFLRNLGV